MSESRSSTTVPPVVRFAGMLEDFDGHPITTIAEVTFSIWTDPHNGTRLWTETQNVQPDPSGRYTVLLGAANAVGLPMDLFASGEARWLGVSSLGIPPMRRIALVSVPYALKAADAETLGGRHISDFVLKTPLRVELQFPRRPPIKVPPITIYPIDQRPGTAPTFISTAAVGPSFISQATTGPPFSVMSGTMVRNLNAEMLHGFTDTEFAKLNSSNSFVNVQTLAGGLDLPAASADPQVPGAFSSSPHDFDSSVLDPTTGASLKQTFRWSSHPVMTGAPPYVGQLSLAYGTDGVQPTPTGLSFNFDGTINFASNQQFPPAAVIAAVNGRATSNDPTTAPVVYTASYQWQQQPQPQGSSGFQGIQPGWNSVLLSPCPNGVSGTDNWHYIFISGTGTPEAVLISGGTCVSGAKNGTIQFNAAYAHPAGYSIGSATGGLQEAVNAAILPGSNAQTARSIVITPGNYLLVARLSIRASDLHISGYGATATCAMSDTCIMLGDPSNTNMFVRIVIEGLLVRPAVQNGTFSAIEDNANGSQMRSIAPAQGTNAAFRFGHILQIDNDQAASMDRIDMAGTSTIRCDAQFCGSAIFAPGPFGINAAVGWVSNSNLNPQCAGNGIDWQSGNTIHVANTVIEGYAQFGVRAGTARGGYGNLTMDNVYEEVGNCSNPAGNIGHAGVIAQGGDVHITGGMGPDGAPPCFSSTCPTGHVTRYYIVAQNSRYGASNPLEAGAAASNGTSVPVSWPVIPGATSYDLLAVDNVVTWYAGGSSPNGVGAFGVAVGISPSSCSAGVCTYVDTYAPRQTYTLAAPTYFPLLTYWPGPIVLGSSADSRSPYGPSVLYIDQAGSGIVAEQGISKVAVLASSCSGQSAASPLWMQCQTSVAPPSGVYDQQATIMLVKPNADGNLATNMKGRLNFATLGTGPSHIITLSDSNFAKTIATENNRPSNDPTDAFIGYDQGNGDPTQIGISFGAPLSLSNYIGNVGDGANWSERLTASLKTFKVPLQTTPVPFVSLPLCSFGTEGANRAVLDSSTNSWGATVSGGGNNHVLAYCNGTNWTVAAK